MKEEYRLYSMIACLIILALASVLTLFNIDLGVMLTLFVAGWALREILDHKGERKE